MTAHWLPGGLYASRERDIREPERDELRTRSAVLQPGGKPTYVEAELHRFDALNPTHEAVDAIAALGEQLRDLAKDSDRSSRSLRRTRPTVLVTTDERIGPRPRLHVIEPFVLGALSVLALYASNVILANYIVKSTTADLFANNLGTARLFSVMPIFAAVGIKAFERRLGSDAARDWYGAILFALGIVSFSAWSVAAAYAFAPDLGTSTDWLTTPGSGNSIPVVLVLSHIIGDVAWGYVLFSAAERLALGNCVLREFPNPRHASLAAAKAALAAEVEARRREMAAEEQYLARVAAAREATRIKAELDYERACELWLQAQHFGLACAISRFLNP